MLDLRSIQDTISRTIFDVGEFMKAANMTEKYLESPNSAVLSSLDPQKRDQAIAKIFHQAAVIKNGAKAAHLFFIPIVLCPEENEQHKLPTIHSFVELASIVAACIQVESTTTVEVRLLHQIITHEEIFDLSAKKLKRILERLVMAGDIGQEGIVPHAHGNNPYISYLVGCYESPIDTMVKIDEQKLVDRVTGILNFELSEKTLSRYKVLPPSSYQEAIVNGTVEWINLFKNVIAIEDDSEWLEQGGHASEIRVEVELMPDRKNIVLHGQSKVATVKFNTTLMGSEGVRKIMDAGFQGGSYIANRTIN